jgi:N-acetylmuramidase/Putative peptidoglycan binding domain
MPPLPFQGSALALTSNGLATVASKLRVHAPEIWAVLSVETRGCGYLPDRRPQILYERHIFHRLTHGEFDDGDISDPLPGGYGATGAHQYERLAEAITKERIAALKSASWGLGQIMGENFVAAGFRNVEGMVDAMSQSEDAQLVAMGSFLTSARLRASLQAHDWTTFARGYNGPNFAINRYDVRLNGEFQKFSVGILPDLNVRAAQLYLTYLGFHPGPIDGIAGGHTLSALAQFQLRNGMPQTSNMDEDTITLLRSALAAIDDIPSATTRVKRVGTGHALERQVPKRRAVRQRSKFR